MKYLKPLLKHLRPVSARRRRRVVNAGRWTSVQSLEVRALLAGNVLATLSSDGDLVLTGDRLGNSVDVVVDDGNIVVRGRENTTINGGTTPFVAVTGSTTLSDDFFARLGGGDDVLFVEGITITGRAAVDSHDGYDRIGFDSSSIGQDLIIRTANGADIVNLEDVQVGRDLVLDTGRQGDTIRLAGTSVSNDLSIATGQRPDHIILDNITVGDDLRADTGEGTDDFIIMNSSIGDSLHVRTQRSSDFVMVDATSVGGMASIGTQGGYDNVVIDNSSQIGTLHVNTGGRRDAVQIDSSTTVTGPTRIRGSESSAVSDAVRDGRLNSSFNGSLTFSDAVNTFFDDLATAPLTLTVDASINGAIESSDTLITSDPNFALEVVTQPGATVAVDSDGDGEFDDASATADDAGNATLNVTLTHTDANNGANVLNVQASNAVDTSGTEQVNVHLAEGSVVRFDTTLGTWDVETLDADAPGTVAAFMDDLNRYANTIVHRNVSDFIVQGGGFSVDGTTVQNAPSFSAPPNEFSEISPPNSNLRGTLSTAQTSNINSFTGQWFVNTIDNDATSPINNLDAVPHTVFGRVIGSGMTVIDTINNTPDFNVSGLLTGSGASALTDVPLVNYTDGSVPTEDNFIRFNSVTKILSPPGTDNTFAVFENSPDGTEVGTIASASASTAPVIFELENSAQDAELNLYPDDHLEGDTAAPVVLIEYLSLQCPSCATAHPEIQQLLADNPDDLLVVRRHLPLDTDTGDVFEHSFEAALAAEAAGRQGMFDEMVDELFARQADWTNAVSPAQAQAVFDDIAVNTLGLDATQFADDMADTALADRINRDITDAGALGATSTPTYFLNGQQTSGIPTSTDVQNAVQAADQTFALDRLTGELTVANGAALDFETTPSFVFNVTVTNGTTETIQTTINLIDIFAG